MRFVGTVPRGQQAGLGVQRKQQGQVWYASDRGKCGTQATEQGIGVQIQATGQGEVRRLRILCDR